jgi:hypothetical protein
MAKSKKKQKKQSNIDKGMQGIQGTIELNKTK